MEGFVVLMGALLGGLLANGNWATHTSEGWQAPQAQVYQAPTIEEQIKYDNALAERDSVLFMRDLDNKIVYNLVDK